ncbi:glycosyltransferase family 4 protein [Pseudomonas wadenswilerensis]|uniref:glycosyltransferase family 4 protein n=1 Tax=Pseudomonas wadenswilerensis TaxID=1785161 RepID=UPI00215FD66D|nr:glycosyltransferase family 4 protein [Pseudomonas wadenswilerensis]UVM20600.1 glycosyltransferase family 4 protein [Pseudomonas wadenswilerensis]
MKIVHLCLSCFYIDNYRYQENELVREHVSAGHDVLVVASTETYIDNLSLGYVAPSEYMGSDGAKVIRLPYAGAFPFFIKKKLRMHPGVASILERFSPDVIVFHGMCGWELLTVATYKRANPQVRLYVDSHEDANNSATGTLSKLLHRFYYRPIIRRALPWIDKVLCISLETVDFCRDQYGVAEKDMEFFPLGGYIADDATYQKYRSEARASLGLQQHHTVFLQSGKFDSKKKLIESLAAFASTRAEDFRFLIVGRVHESIEEKVTQLSSADARVQHLGWKTADELYRLLCAVDVYVQPGSQSATMQMSLCARRPVVIADVPSHQPFVKGNGWKVSTQEQLVEAFRSVESNPAALEEMSQRSLEIASDLLDYRRMATRLLV